jgi:hypothetical protein
VEDLRPDQLVHFLRSSTKVGFFLGVKTGGRKSHTWAPLKYSGTIYNLCGIVL